MIKALFLCGMSERTAAHLALLIVALIYGANYIIAKDVMQDKILTPQAFIFMRVVFGVIAFTIFHRLAIKEKIERSDLWRFFICGALGVALNQLFFFMGLEKTTPIHASLLMVTNPILVFILSAAILNERVSVRKAIGIALGIGGTVMLLLTDTSVQWTGDTFTGDLMVWFNASCYALYLVLVKPLLEKYNPFTVITWVFIMGSLIIIPVGFPYVVEVNWELIEGRYVWQIIYVLLFTTVLAYALNIFALRSVTATVVSIYIYLQPLLAAFLSVLLGWEEVSWPKVLSAVAIFTGVYLVSVRKRKKIL